MKRTVTILLLVLCAVPALAQENKKPPAPDPKVAVLSPPAGVPPPIRVPTQTLNRKELEDQLEALQKERAETDLRYDGAIRELTFLLQQIGEKEKTAQKKLEDEQKRSNQQSAVSFRSSVFSPR